MEQRNGNIVDFPSKAYKAYCDTKLDEQGNIGHQTVFENFFWNSSLLYEQQTPT